MSSIKAVTKWAWVRGFVFFLFSAFALHAGPFQSLSGSFPDTWGKTAWGPYTALTLEYEPGTLTETQEEPSGHFESYGPGGYIRLLAGSDVLLTGYFLDAGAWKSDSLQPDLFGGTLEALLAPELAQALGYGNVPVSVVASLRVTSRRAFAGPGERLGDWELLIQSYSAVPQTRSGRTAFRQPAPVPEAATVGVTAAALLLLYSSVVFGRFRMQSSQ